jgi:hypothetical protein
MGFIIAEKSLCLRNSTTKRMGSAEYGAEVREENGVRRRFPLLGERVRVRGSVKAIDQGHACGCGECNGSVEEEDFENYHAEIALTPALSPGAEHVPQFFCWTTKSLRSKLGA